MQTWRTFKHLITLLLLLLNAANLYAASERVALVIGNSQYQHLNTLKNPVNDAQAVAQRLQALNFQLVDAKGKNTNKPVLNLKENAFAKTVSNFAKRANGAEIAFLYYAGHGMQESGTSYLLPIDAPKNDVELIIRNAISLDRTLDKLDGKAQLTVAIFDACREIPNLEETTRSAGLSPNAYRGLARLKNPGKSRIVAFAGAAGELVPDGDTQNSPYTLELIKVLQNPQGEIDNVLQRVAWNVVQASQRQSPEISIHGVQPGRFYFTEPQKQPSAEIVFWQSVENQPSEAGYQAYLNQHPQGIFASLAQRRLLTYQPPTPLPPKPVVVTTPTKLPYEPEMAPIPAKLPYEPEMVPIPGGTFRMGDIQGGGYIVEGPVHKVNIKSFMLSKHEVTLGQFKAFTQASGYQTDAEKNDGCYIWKESKWQKQAGYSYKNPGFKQTDQHPVACVNWNDAQAYIRWLNQQTGKTYRLPSEAEWEYAARAGGETKYHFGNDADKLCQYANGADKTAKKTYKNWMIANCDDGYLNTAPVGTFLPNRFELHDMHGNVWEWVQDCWRIIYENMPTNGTALQKEASGDCTRRVVRGGGWLSIPRILRSANRDWFNPAGTNDTQGFRLARAN